MVRCLEFGLVLVVFSSAVGCLLLVSGRLRRFMLVGFGWFWLLLRLDLHGCAAVFLQVSGRSRRFMLGHGLRFGHWFPRNFDDYP
jgi:hypothetical protein